MDGGSLDKAEPPNYDQVKEWRSIVTLVVFVLASKSSSGHAPIS